MTDDVEAAEGGWSKVVERGTVEPTCRVTRHVHRVRGRLGTEWARAPQTAPSLLRMVVERVLMPHKERVGCGIRESAE